MKRLMLAGALAVLGAGACSGGDGAGQAPGGSGGATGGTSGGTAGGASGGAAGGAPGGAAGGASGGGSPSAAELLAKVAGCGTTTVKGGFGLDGAGSISIYQCAGALFWKADMDVDCDGIQTPPCDTDATGQPQTSIVDLAPTGDVDPTKLPYFVIPLGTPETTWYQSHEVQLGQLGAVIYKGRVEYGIFADEAGGAFIGESSYAMCQLFLGAPAGNDDPCDPNHGGIDSADVTYVTFTGAANRVRGADIYDHVKQTTLGGAAARAWVGAP